MDATKLPIETIQLLNITARPQYDQQYSNIDGMLL